MNNLSEDDIEACQKAFADLDEDGLGAIKAQDLTIALERINVPLKGKKLYKLISEIDEKNTGLIKFSDFLQIYHQMKYAHLEEDDQDLVDAFVAIGGQEDKSGSINAELLIKILKEEFQMTINIEKLIHEVDTDGSGQIEFKEFKELLKSNYATENENEND